MIDDDVFRDEVEVSLRQATDGQLARIMQFIDRLPSRGRLDDVVAPIRGRLALARPARSVTSARVLTAPIEDLLVDPACEAAAPSALPRDILGVFHRIALDAVGAAELAALEDEAQGAVMGDADRVVAMGRRLWPIAAAALRAFRADGEATPAGWRPAHQPRLMVIAELLEHGEALLGFLARLPIRGFSHNGHVAQAACDMLAWAGGQSDTLGRCAAAMLLRRLGDPATAFAAVEHCGCGGATARAAGLLAGAVDECLREVELTVAATVASPPPSPFAAAENLLRLAAMLKTLEAGPPPPGAVNFAIRLAAARNAAQSLAEAAYQRLLNGPAGARFAEAAEAGPAASDDDVADAEALARAVAKIAAAGALLGCADRLAASARPWRDDMRRRIVAAAQALEMPEQRLAGVIDGLRLLEIALGADEAAALAQSLGLHIAATNLR